LSFFSKSPFIILGISPKFSEREVLKHYEKLKIYLDLGKKVEFDLDAYYHPVEKRTKKKIVEAKQKINQPEDKLFYSFFSYSHNQKNAIDEIAFEHLKLKEHKKALDVWKKGTSKKISSSNESNYFNQMILHLFLAEKSPTKAVKRKNLNESLRLSGLFFSSKFFPLYIKSVLGVSSRVIKSSEKVLIHYLSKVFNEFSSVFKVENILENLETYPSSIKDIFLKKFIKEIQRKIENPITDSKTKLENERKNPAKTGFELVGLARPPLLSLRKILGTSDIRYKAFADKLALSLRDCYITHWNRNSESKKSPLEEIISLAKKAKGIAKSKKNISQIKGDLDWLQDMAKEPWSVRLALEDCSSDLEHLHSKMGDFHDRLQSWFDWFEKRNFSPFDYRNITKQEDYLELKADFDKFFRESKAKLSKLKEKLGDSHDTYKEMSSNICLFGCYFGSFHFALGNKTVEASSRELEELNLYASQSQEVENGYNYLVLEHNKTLRLMGKHTLSTLDKVRGLAKNKESRERYRNLRKEARKIYKKPSTARAASSASSGCILALFWKGLIVFSCWKFFLLL